MADYVLLLHPFGASMLGRLKSSIVSSKGFIISKVAAERRHGLRPLKGRVQLLLLGFDVGLLLFAASMHAFPGGLTTANQILKSTWDIDHPPGNKETNKQDTRIPHQQHDDDKNRWLGSPRFPVHTSNRGRVSRGKPGQNAYEERENSPKRGGSAVFGQIRPLTIKK